jgi:signal transduction histidine kinase
MPFSVDTHLFRELGELLVGRDSTALVELIKNSYDADATEVVVYGEGLDDLRRGFILVTDDGTGMTPREFNRGFLRVASRNKRADDRRTARFGRQVTGEKGIGRLAAHKLARVIDIDSTSATGKPIRAHIDWDAVEEFETLDEVDGDALTVEERPRGRAESGTVIRLSSLRRAWTDTQRTRFVSEVQSFEPAPLLTDPLPDALGVRATLFDRPRVRDSKKSVDPGFHVRLDGEFLVGDSFWDQLGREVAWVIDIRARKTGVQYLSSPTSRKSGARPTKQSGPHPSPKDGPFFDARILVREGPIGDRSVRAFNLGVSGVRVYMEGFRVAPYGERGNDWLQLDYDYTRRSDRLGLLDDGPASEDRIGLRVSPNNNYVGAVFLTEAWAPGLRMLVNREGFVPDAAYERLYQLIRRGIDLNTRARSAAGDRARVQRKTKREIQDQGASSVGLFQSERLLGETIRAATEGAQSVRTALLAGDDSKATSSVDDLLRTIERATELTDEAISERSLLRVLASVGTQMGAFVHEIEGLVAIAQIVERGLERVAERVPSARAQIAPLRAAIEELRSRVDRQAAYLAEVVSVDARRRRSRQRLRDRFESAERIVAATAAARKTTITNDIDPGFRTPPMFPAEITSVLSNLMTNAVKAAGEKGQIRASADRGADGEIVLTVENTGARVAPDAGERWFRPFESTTVEQVDPVLGQGMGLGLPITRSILEDYRASIKFATPSKGFATAVEVRFP